MNSQKQGRTEPPFGTTWIVESPDIVHPAEGTALPRYMHSPWANRPPQPEKPGQFEEDSTEMAVDEPTPRPRDYSIPHSDITLPKPELAFSFRMSVALDTFMPVGVTPSGKRAFMSFKGGRWSGPFGSGTVAPGGQAEVITYADLTDDLVTSFLLRTNDEPPAFITLKSKGFRSGPPEVLKALVNPETAASVDPNSFKSRLIITMQTGDDRYKDIVNYGFWIGSGLKIGMEVVYDAYHVL